MLMLLKKDICIKIVVAIICRQRDKKARCHKNMTIYFVTFSQCLPEIISLQIILCLHYVKTNMSM